MSRGSAEDPCLVVSDDEDSQPTVVGKKGDTQEGRATSNAIEPTSPTKRGRADYEHTNTFGRKHTSTKKSTTVSPYVVAVTVKNLGQVLDLAKTIPRGDSSAVLQQVEAQLTMLKDFWSVEGLKLWPQANLEHSSCTVTHQANNSPVSPTTSVTEASTVPMLSISELELPNDMPLAPVEDDGASFTEKLDTSEQCSLCNGKFTNVHAHHQQCIPEYSKKHNIRCYSCSQGDLATNDPQVANESIPRKPKTKSLRAPEKKKIILDKLTAHGRASGYNAQLSVVSLEEAHRKIFGTDIDYENNN